MSKTCATCDEELDPERDKDKGRYHDRCLPCIRDDVDVTRHVDMCEDDKCIVCASHAEEQG